MKANLKNGILTISPDNSEESYDLEYWDIKNLKSLDIQIDLRILNMHEVEKGSQ